MPLVRALSRSPGTQPRCLPMRGQASRPFTPVRIR
jgi:hypothetical protein